MDEHNKECFACKTFDYFVSQIRTGQTDVEAFHEALEYLWEIEIDPILDAVEKEAMEIGYHNGFLRALKPVGECDGLCDCDCDKGEANEED